MKMATAKVVGRTFPTTVPIFVVGHASDGNDTDECGKSANEKDDMHLFAGRLLLLVLNLHSRSNISCVHARGLEIAAPNEPV